MRIAAAQIKFVKEDINASISKHLDFINTAANHKADLIFFPELSITGYEPSLASTYACDISDHRFQPFQDMASDRDLIISLGMPICGYDGIHIGMIIFHPNGSRQLYTKAYLHEDELPFFKAKGQNEDIVHQKERIAFCICYELSIAAHASQAKDRGATVYLASVAKHPDGVSHVMSSLSQRAAIHDMSVLMANAIGQSDDFIAAGQSAVWNQEGILLEQMDAEHEGLLLFDTKTQDTEIISI